MSILDLANQPGSVLEQAALLLVEEFNEPHGWPTIEIAREEVASVVREGFARAMIEDGVVLGWVGGLPEYHGRVWELHPIVVRPERRRQGIGRALVVAFEEEASRRGALTATLGTDDDSGMTSLADVDLYRDVPRHMAELRDLGRDHPFLFYQKLGYVVTGVMPDANGRGRPDIYMSKALPASAKNLVEPRRTL
jgi:aminoglycoside 6'-N-acetyltransferase I